MSAKKKARRPAAKDEPPIDKAAERDELFARAYVANKRNATAAALEVMPSWSYDTARTEGSKLLAKPHVRRRVRELLSKAFEKLEITAERTLREIARVAYHADMEQFAEWDETGVRLFPSDMLPEGFGSLVAEVSETVTQHGGTKRIKLFDKVSALRDLAKIQGLMEEGDDTVEERARQIRDALERLEDLMTTEAA